MTAQMFADALLERALELLVDPPLRAIAYLVLRSGW